MKLLSFFLITLTFFSLVSPTLAALPTDIPFGGILSVISYCQGTAPSAGIHVTNFIPGWAVAILPPGRPVSPLFWPATPPPYANHQTPVPGVNTLGLASSIPPTACCVFFYWVPDDPAPWCGGFQVAGTIKTVVSLAGLRSLVGTSLRPGR